MRRVAKARLAALAALACALTTHEAAGQGTGGPPPPSPPTIVGTAGSDVIRPALRGGSSNGLPDATAGDDVIDGREGDDEITPGPGSDTVVGGDGDDTVFLYDGDAAPEESLYGNGGFNRLVIAGSGLFDLTRWLIVDVQGLTLANGATVRLTPDQVLGFTDIAGLGGTLELADPRVGTIGIYPLLPRVGTGIAPFTTIVGSNGDDLVSLPQTPAIPIAFDGAAGHDTAVLPRASGDYAPLPGAPFPTASPVEVRDASTGVLLYTLVDVEAIRFAADLPPLMAQPDQVEATIGHAGSFDPVVILGNDGGYGLSILNPSRGRLSITSAGGRLSSLGAGMPLTYSPPAEIIPFTDWVTYAVEDVLGNQGTMEVYFNVANEAPEAPTRSFIRLAGGIVLVEDLLAGVSDPEGGSVTFGEFTFDAATGFAEPVYEAGTTTVIGYRVFEGTTTPGVGRFLYTVRDNSGAIGSGDEGEVIVTFVPLEAHDDALRGTAPSGDGAVHGELIWTDVLLANDAPGVVFDGLVGASEVSPGTFLLPIYDPVTFRHIAFVYYESADPQLKHIRYYAEEAGAFTFSYSVRDGAGGTATATVTVTVDNHAPVAAPQVIPVPAGPPVTVQLRDLAFGGVYGPVNSDADGDPIVFACYGLLPAGDPRGSLQGLGPVNQFDPTDFGSIVFTPAPGFSGDVTLNYCIKDLPNLGGAERNTYSNSTFTFRMGTPPVVAFQSTNAGAIEEGGLHQIQITRTGDLSGITSVTFAIRGGTATTDDIGLVRGTDHVNGGFATLGTGFGTYSLTFNPGVGYVLLAVASAQNSAVEPDETFVLELLSATGATLGDPSVVLATGRILNEDVPPVVAFQSTSAGAIEEGGLHQIQVTRTGDVSAATTVTFAIQGGTATTDDIGLVRGTDHVNGGFATLGTGFGTYSLTFNPGVDYVLLAVASAQDDAVEPDETFVLELLSATGATLGDPSVRVATGRILNDDVPPPQVEVSIYVSGPWTEAVGGVPGYVRFYIRRTGPDLSQPTVVHWTLGPEEAPFQPGQSSDFVGGFRSGSFVLSGPSELFVPLDFVFANDDIFEPTEWFRFTITGYDNAQPLPPTALPYFNFSVVDDDPPVNTPPVGVADSATTTAGTPVVIAVIANDTDAENHPLAAGAFANLVGGTLSLPGDGTVLFTPTPGFVGTGGFTYRPYDGQAQGNVTAVTVIVTAPPPPPPPCAADVSGVVTVTRGTIRYVSARGRFEQALTLRNSSTGAITGPVALVVDALAAHATMVNGAGVTACAAPAGAPFVTVSTGNDNVLSPGETASVVVAFTTTLNQPFTYTTRVLAGTSR